MRCDAMSFACIAGAFGPRLTTIKAKIPTRINTALRNGDNGGFPKCASQHGQA
jgi:hypothetical protein